MMKAKKIVYAILAGIILTQVPMIHVAQADDNASEQSMSLGEFMKRADVGPADSIETVERRLGGLKATEAYDLISQAIRDNEVIITELRRTQSELVRLKTQPVLGKTGQVYYNISEIVKYSWVFAAMSFAGHNIHHALYFLSNGEIDGPGFYVMNPYEWRRPASLLFWPSLLVSVSASVYSNVYEDEVSATPQQVAQLEESLKQTEEQLVQQNSVFQSLADAYSVSIKNGLK